MVELALVYSEDLLSYDLGPSHPLRQLRVKKALKLMEEIGLLNSGKVALTPPREASEEELKLFHDEAYIDYVKERCAEGEGYLDYGDTPVFKDCFRASKLVVGATLKALEEVIEGRALRSVNLAGGLHHAHPDRASGFCVFNDVAIGIAYLFERGFEKVAYVDIDAHHGDGVMYGFYGDGRLLNLDFHEDGRFLFPGTGSLEELGEGEAKGLKVNFPLPPYSGDDVFLKAFKRLVPKLVRKFEPEYLILQCGADGYKGDPLTHLQYSTYAYEEVVKELIEIAQEVCDGRLTVLGGGGYSYDNVARVWCLATCLLAGYEAPKLREIRDREPTISPREVIEEVEERLRKLSELLKTT